MYEKMQESELTEIIPLICMSAIWGQYLFLLILSLLRATVRGWSVCDLMAGILFLS